MPRMSKKRKQEWALFLVEVVEKFVKMWYNTFYKARKLELLKIIQTVSLHKCYR